MVVMVGVGVCGGGGGCTCEFLKFLFGCASKWVQFGSSPVST